ncbi:hypothetical protein ROZALSC1DRAFT_30148, partial [Rozella allomycis CSF55]
MLIGMKGDPEAWKRPIRCKKHGIVVPSSLDEMENNMFKKLPFEENARLSVSTVLSYIIENIKDVKAREEEVDEGEIAVILYNDETHSYQQVIGVLQRAIGVTKEQGQKMAETVDKRGREIVIVNSNVDLCRQVAAIISSIGLYVELKNPIKFCRQQICSILLDWLIKVCKGHPTLCHIVSQKLVESQETLDVLLLNDIYLWKEMRNGIKEMLINSLLVDAECRNEMALSFTRCYPELANQFFQNIDREPEMSIIFFSVQIFTTPRLALFVSEKGFIFEILSILKEQFEKCVKDGEFDCDHEFVQLKRYIHVFLDLRYFLSTDSVKEYARSNSELKNAFLEFFSLFQGIDKFKREEQIHVEYESDSWVNAFNLSLQLSKIVTLVSEIYRNEISFEIDFKNENKNDFMVSKDRISFHLPLQWVFGASLFHCKAIDKIPANRMKEIMDGPLSLFVLESQVRSGMWVRNGFSLRNQLLNFCGIQMREACFDPCFYLIQLGAINLGLDEFYEFVLQRFEINFELNDSNLVFAVEDFLQLIIMIFSERMWLCEMDIENEIKRELVHQLMLGPISFSDLIKKVPERLQNHSDFLTILKSLTTFKFPDSINENGVYILKDEFYSLIDPFFIHYSRKDKSNLYENLKSIVIKPPKFRPPILFENINNLLFNSIYLNLLIKCFNLCVETSNDSLIDTLVYSWQLLGCSLLENEDLETKEEVILVYENILSSRRMEMFSSQRKRIDSSLEELKKLKDEHFLKPLLNRVDFDEENVDKRKSKANLRRKKLMEEMAKVQQSAFSKFEEYLTDEEEEQEENYEISLSWNLPSGVCIVCQEMTSENSTNFGFLSFVQSSRLLGYQGTFISTCGHSMHLNCYFNYKKNSPSSLEYQCPLCKTLCNCILPATPLQNSFYDDSPISIFESTDVKLLKENFDILLGGLENCLSFTALSTLVEKFTVESNLSLNRIVVLKMLLILVTLNFKLSERGNSEDIKRSDEEINSHNLLGIHNDLINNASNVQNFVDLVVKMLIKSHPINGKEKFKNDFKILFNIFNSRIYNEEIKEIEEIEEIKNQNLNLFLNATLLLFNVHFNEEWEIKAEDLLDNSLHVQSELSPLKLINFKLFNLINLPERFDLLFKFRDENP